MAAKRKQAPPAVDIESRNTQIWLDALEDAELNDWERGFVESMYEWFVVRGKKLTVNQYDTLERIYRRLN